MFDKVEYRFALRALLVGVASAVSSLVADGSWKEILSAGVVAAFAYAGVGAALPQVEPHIGRKLKA